MSRQHIAPANTCVTHTDAKQFSLDLLRRSSVCWRNKKSLRLPFTFQAAARMFLSLDNVKRVKSKSYYTLVGVFDDVLQEADVPSEFSSGSKTEW